MKTTSKPTPKSQVLIEANRLAEAGLSPIPIRADGTKAAAVEWKPYQEHIATPKELEVLFSRNGCGIGIVTGEVSGGLVVIDIDDDSLVEPWQERMRENKFLDHLTMVKTPRGAHFYLLCEDKVAGSQKLARKIGKNGKTKTTIEIRAEGNYVIAPGSPAGCHPSGNPYEQQTGDLTKLSLFTSEKFEELLEVCYSFNELVEPKRVRSEPSRPGGNRPGDIYCARASWEEVLEPRGWEKVRERGDGVTEWRRPGKESGISATTNIGGSDLLYVFSTNADPLEADTSYSKFEAYTFLNHAGDFTKAAAQLRAEGYVPDWQEPADLPSLLPIAPPLPPDLLPEALRGYIEDEAERMQVPLEMIAVPNLIALASVVGRQRGIKPKKRDDWLVTPNLWGAVVARPGLLKSPAQEKGLRQIEILVAEEAEKYQAQRAESLAEEQVYKLRIKGVETQIKEAIKDNPDACVHELQSKLAKLEAKRAAERITEHRYKTNDSTVEKLEELLAENTNGLLLIQDELSGWIRSFDKKGREGDREFYLASWNGDHSYTVDRIGRGTTHIPAVCLSIVGGIQPGKLQRYVADALQGGWGDDGFLQRFQLMVYPEVNRDWTNIDREPDRKARSRAIAVFRELDQLREVSGDVPALHFDSDAQEVFNSWRGSLEKRLRSGAIDCQALASHLDKYRSLMPALALLFELADNQKAKSVGLDATRRAALWCEFLEAHARKVYAGAIQPDLQAAHALAKKIKAGEIKDGTAVRDIYRNKWSFLTSVDTVKEGLALLEAYGWVRLKKVTTGGCPSTILELNPTFGTFGS